MSDYSDSDDNVVPFRRPSGEALSPSERQARRAARKAARERKLDEDLNVYEARQSYYSDYNRVSFKPGQNVICRVVEKEPGGYAVVVDPPSVPGWTWGYVPSDQTHMPGKELLTQFVCWDKGRLLLTERFTFGRGPVDNLNPDT
tara:strand:+ start:189 stop:620 length:432 start_codon:yes stop_codon:yes gene_type:complete